MYQLRRVFKVVAVTSSFVLMGIVFSLSIGNNGGVTTNDTFTLLNSRSIIEELSSRGVLGASSGDDVCKDEEVIGWLDYRGNTIIIESVPFGEESSIVCFEDEEDANNQGYFKTQENFDEVLE